MRLVLAMVLAGLVALPLSVGAQDGEEGTTSEPKLQEPVPSAEAAREGGGLSPRVRKRTRQKWDPHVYELPSSEPATEQPALQLKLDATGVDVTPSPPRTPKGYTLEEMELRVKRAEIGLAVSGVGLAAGLVLTTVGGLVSWANTPLGGETEAPAAWAAMVAGVTVMAIGAVAMIASGVMLRVRIRDRGSLLWATPYGTPRRVQWDLARSRLVF